jgi:hypothetical protein
MLATNEQRDVMRHNAHNEISAGRDCPVSLADVRSDRSAKNIFSNQAE